MEIQKENFYHEILEFCGFWSYGWDIAFGITLLACGASLFFNAYTGN